MICRTGSHPLACVHAESRPVCSPGCIPAVTYREHRCQMCHKDRVREREKERNVQRERERAGECESERGGERAANKPEMIRSASSCQLKHMHSVTEMSAFRVPSLSLSPLPGRTASLLCSLVPAHSQGWNWSPVQLQIIRVGSVWKVENVVSKSSIGETSKEMNLPWTAHLLGSYCDVKHSLKCPQTSESLTKQLLKKKKKYIV